MHVVMSNVEGQKHNVETFFGSIVSFIAFFFQYWIKIYWVYIYIGFWEENSKFHWIKVLTNLKGTNCSLASQAIRYQIFKVNLTDVAFFRSITSIQ